MRRVAGLAFLAMAAVFWGCRERTPTAAENRAQPAVSAPLPASPTSRLTIPGPTASRLTVGGGKARFLIDAPLEKIRGGSDVIDGWIDARWPRLEEASGEVRVKLTELKTETFDDAAKNESQTEHARNWMEVGPESPPASKATFEYARFRLKSIEVLGAKPDEVPEQNGARSFDVRAAGDLELHGVTAPQRVIMKLRVAGPITAPTVVHVETATPFDVSLKIHDIKPRDTVGKFLNGALTRIGKKIDDRVQISLSLDLVKADAGP